MVSDRNIKIAALVIWALVYGCAAYVWVQDIMNLQTTLMIIGLVPGMYLVGRFIAMRLGKQFGMQRKKSNQISNAKLVHLALIITGMSLLGTMVGSLLVEQGVITADAKDAIAPQVNGIVTGLFFIIMGNYTPKMIAPLTREICDPVRHQAFQRQVGWTFFIAGFLYILAWVTLPAATAKTATLIILAICFLNVFPRAIYYSVKSAQQKHSMNK